MLENIIQTTLCFCSEHSNSSCLVHLGVKTELLESGILPQLAVALPHCRLTPCHLTSDTASSCAHLSVVQPGPPCNHPPTQARLVSVAPPILSARPAPHFYNFTKVFLCVQTYCEHPVQKVSAFPPAPLRPHSPPPSPPASLLTVLVPH